VREEKKGKRKKNRKRVREKEDKRRKKEEKLKRGEEKEGGKKNKGEGTGSGPNTTAPSHMHTQLSLQLHLGAAQKTEPPLAWDLPSLCWVWLCYDLFLFTNAQAFPSHPPILQVLFTNSESYNSSHTDTMYPAGSTDPTGEGPSSTRLGSPRSLYSLTC
jgi:hypothetical protein